MDAGFNKQVIPLKNGSGSYANLLVPRFTRVGNTSRRVEPTWLNSESSGLCWGSAFDNVAKEPPSQGASFPRRMTSAACPSNTKGIDDNEEFSSTCFSCSRNYFDFCEDKSG